LALTCATLRSKSGTLHLTYIAGRSFGFRPYASRICRATRTLRAIIRHLRFALRLDRRGLRERHLSIMC
jgi:hypothetical protein